MPAKTPEISVIIPTFQEGNHIAETLSNLKRTKSPVEIIVVDGGSHDETVKNAKQFADKVYTIRKRGIALGRNLGAEHARGRILLFSDGDVIFPSDFAERTLKAFENPLMVGATCNIMPNPRQARLEAKLFFSFYNALIRVISIIRPHARGEFFAVRKTAFTKVKGFDENMPCLEDHELASRLAKVGKVVFIPDLTVYESLRRFTKLGFLRVVGTWLMDYVCFMIRRRPVSKVWQPVR